MPAPSRPLLVASAIVELTCVPWPSKSTTGPPPGMKTKSCGLTRRDAGRSGLTSNGIETFSIFEPVKSGKVKDCLTVVNLKARRHEPQRHEPALSSDGRRSSSPQYGQ